MKSLEYYLKKAKFLEGKTISEVLPKYKPEYSENRRITKSVFANFIEKDYFGEPLSNHSNPDFQDVNLELKTSGIKFVKTRNIYRAKERLVISQVNYHEIALHKNWIYNPSLKKMFKMLIVLYFYENKPKKFEDFQIIHTFIWEPSDKEVDKIQNDYTIIRDKVLKGEANSEGDNEFFSTTTKHTGKYNKDNPSKSTKSSLSSHPYLEFAKKRGFCIKQKAFDRIIADSLKKNLKNVKNSLGLLKEDYPNFK